MIVLVSKNDKSDIDDVLTNHQSKILKKKDITAMKINWNEKRDLWLRDEEEADLPDQLESLSL